VDRRIDAGGGDRALQGAVVASVLGFGVLAIALLVIEPRLLAMPGEIWCDERPGGGARFGFSLPAHSAPAGERSPSATALRA
jgi:hypothetical protein